MVVDVPPVLAGSKFQFLQSDQGTIPNNCPSVVDKNGNVVNDDPKTGQKPATKKFETLGIFPPTILFQRAFAEDPRFNWKGYWTQQCSSDGLKPIIDDNELLSDFDTMQKARLGNLVTGVTTFAGNIGKKAILDGDLDLAGKIYEQLVGFKDYIENGIKNRSFPDTPKNEKNACDGDRKLYCDDALARTYLGIGKMTVAAVESGLATDNGKPVKISRSLINRTVAPEQLGDAPLDKDALMKDPYKVGAETLYRCMIESTDGSLKRDICTEMIKDVVVAGVKANEEQVYEDGIKHLSGYYDKDFFEGKKDTWDNLKTWVNSTVWMTDGLIELMEAQDAGILRRGDKGVGMVIKAIRDQKKEGLMEFSTADWIAQQALIITANKGRSGIYTNHDTIIKEIVHDRLPVWNPWLSLYTGSFKRCPSENKDCMGDVSSDANKALRQLAISINNGCIAPVAKKMKGNDPEGDLDIEAIDNCTKAMGQIIEKAGNEDVLRAATEAWFLYGQENGGMKYIPKVKELLEPSIAKRFDPSYIGKMNGATETDLIVEGNKTIQAYNSTLFNRRLERPATKTESKILNALLKGEKSSTFSFLKNYFLDTTIIDGVDQGTKIVKNDNSPLFILDNENRKLLPIKMVESFQKQMK